VQQRGRMLQPPIDRCLVREQADTPAA